MTALVSFRELMQEESVVGDGGVMRMIEGTGDRENKAAAWPRTTGRAWRPSLTLHQTADVAQRTSGTV
jgi:hypothetical protein